MKVDKHLDVEMVVTKNHWPHQEQVMMDYHNFFFFYKISKLAYEGKYFEYILPGF